MIYTGSEEIRNIMLGNEEISAIYCGEDLIYPMTVTAWSVDPLTISAAESGTTQKIKIAAMDDWTITSSESWVTFSVTGGTSGRSRVEATIAANAGPQRTATITVADTGNTTALTISVTQEATPFQFTPDSITIPKTGTTSPGIHFTISSPYAYSTVSEFPVGAISLTTGSTWGQPGIAEGWLEATELTGDTPIDGYITASISVDSSITLNVEQVNQVDYELIPLTFEILSGGTISWKSHNVQEATISYSINEGPWVDITSNGTGASFSVSEGDKVRFKGANEYYASNDSAFNTFSGGTAIFNAYGNIMSLIYEDDFLDKYALSAGYTFHSLFRWTNIISAENLVLPATTLQEWCYKSMFEACPLLVSAPKELPATTLADACYYGMFYNCYSLENAPIIKGETSAWFGCQVTFNNCALLNHLECHLTDLYGCGGWLTGVSATGTFIKNPALTTWSSDENGIPSGWTVIDAE